MQVELKLYLTSSLLVEDYDCRMETLREGLFWTMPVSSHRLMVAMELKGWKWFSLVTFF